MRTTRRAFVAQLSSAGALALACASALFAESPSSVSTSDLISRMKWMNEPEWSRVSGGQITVRSKSKTDFWRKTFYGYVTDNGHFFHLPVNGNFTFQARIGGKYHDQYDQAGIMARLDAENWMKCGTELVDRVRQASGVFTREFSDWSTMNDLSIDSPVWWRAVRKRDCLETLCSFDGQKYQSVRQGYFASARPAEVGIMCASPEGKGFEATFENLRLSQD